MKNIEDLIKIAQQEGEVTYTETESNPDVSKFFIDNEIEPGYTKYNKHFLYLLYVSWTKIRTPVDKRNFHKFATRRLKGKINEYYYKIDSDKLQINIELLKKHVVKTIFKRAEENVKKTQTKRAKS